MPGVAGSMNRGADRRAEGVRIVAFVAVLGLLSVSGIALTAPEAVDLAVTAAPEAAATRPSTGVETRTILFPADRSLGSLRVRKAGPANAKKPFSWWNYDIPSWQYFGQAKGVVQVPADTWLWLCVSGPATRDLSALEQLGADDLHMLSLSWTPATDLCMRHLEGLTGLKFLALQKTNVTDAGMRHLENMRSLEVLVAPPGATEQGLAHLTGLPLLKGLHFYEAPHVSRRMLDVIGQIPAIEELTICRGSLDGSGLAGLVALPNLRELFLGMSSITDKDLSFLAGLPALRVLDVRACDITDAGLEHISQLTDLRTLNLNNSRVTSAGLEQLKPLSQLRALGVRGSAVDDAGIAYLAEAPALEHLDLPNRNITDAGLAHLRNCDRLKYLWVGCGSSSTISDAGLRHVSKLRSLEELHIGGKGITDAGMAELAKLTELSDLGVSYIPLVTNDGWAALARMHSLRVLNLSAYRSTQVTVAGANHLNALKNLEKLYITRVTQDFSVLDLSALTKLNTLSLTVGEGEDPRSISALRDEDLACLANLTQLTMLQVGHGKTLSDAGMAHLAKLYALERVNIGGGRITDDGLTYLADKRRLNYLSLRADITERGLRRLERLEALTYLSVISANEFSPAAVGRLSQALPNAQTINFDDPAKRSRDSRSR